MSSSPADRRGPSARTSGGRRLRAAAGVFAVVVVLVGFVLFQAYGQAKLRLGSEFARQQLLLCRTTARHLRDQDRLGQAGLAAAAADLAAGRAVSEALLRILDDSLGVQARLHRLGADGAVARSWPPSAPPDPAWLALLGPAPAAGTVDVQFLAVDGEPHLVWQRRVGDGRLVLETELLPTLRPPGDPTQEVASGVLLVDPADYRILGATTSLPPEARFDQLFTPSTPALLEALASGRGATDLGAVARPPWPEQPGEPFLIGVEGVRLGARMVSVVATAPRADLVDRSLGDLLGWIIKVGLVMLLGAGSFVGLVSRERAAERQERRRLEERDALYHISLALLSAGTLEEILDEIAARARDLFGAEGATIALLDEAGDELVFRAVAAQTDETAGRLRGLRLSRDEGVLGWVVQHGEAALVNRVDEDPRFASGVDEQTGFSTKALLCAPLIDEAGRCFGAIELVNKQDNPFPASDVPLLRSLAVTAAAAVQRAVYQQRELERDRLRREMELAQAVQQSLLPRAFPTIRGFDVHGDNYPAREVGGDFFDFIPVSDHHLGIVIADVADKGLGAAMFMVLCRSLLYSVAIRELSPARVLDRLNELILQLSDSDLFVTVFYGILDLSSGAMTFSNAGHNPPLLYQAEARRCVSLTVPGMALGVLDGIEFHEGAVEVRPHDLLVFYTDGIPDSTNADGAQFGLDRLREIMRAAVSAGDRAGEATRRILTAVDQFVGAQDQFDDITLAVIRGSDPAADSPASVQEARLRG